MPIRGSFMDFCKKVGIVAGSATAVIFLLNMMLSFAWSTATRPILDAIKAESEAREKADNSLSRDRLDLIDVLMTPQGPARNHKLQEIRSRWAKDAKDE